MDTAACDGEEAYTALLAAAKEGEVELSRHVEVWHQSGQSVHLGPHLTTPSTSHLKNTPDLTVTVEEERMVARHRKMEKDDAKRLVWEAEVPDVQESEDDDNDDVKDDGEDGKDEVKEVKLGKNRTPDSVEEELQRQRADFAVQQKQIFVDYNCSAVTKEELQQHFQQFGKVEEVLLSCAPLTPTTVTFQSAVVAQSLVEKTHTLQHTEGRGGCVPLRLRGGSGGRGRRVPPTQQRHNTCSFRYKQFVYCFG